MSVPCVGCRIGQAAQRLSPHPTALVRCFSSAAVRNAARRRWRVSMENPPPLSSSTCTTQFDGGDEHSTRTGSSDGQGPAHAPSAAANAATETGVDGSDPTLLTTGSPSTTTATPVAAPTIAIRPAVPRGSWLERLLQRVGTAGGGRAVDVDEDRTARGSFLGRILH
jgi:hypothetical protein